MNDLEIRILQYLRALPSGASSSQLAKHCNVSVNTIRRAFSSLLDTLDEESFYLESKPSAGYRLVVEDETKTDLFFRSLISRSNNPLFENDSSGEYKANYIIRRLLCSDQYFSLRFLAEELQYSESSVRRDLKILEEILKHYHLNLVTKKNQGIQIEGDELNKRLCLLHEHKIYVNISEDMQKAEPWFQAVFCIGDQDIRQCRHKVVEAVKNSQNLAFRVTDFPPVYYYLPLIRTRKKYIQSGMVSNVQKEILERNGMIREAQKLLALCHGVLKAEEEDILLYAVILSIFRSVADLKQLMPSERKTAVINAKECLGEVLNRIALPIRLPSNVLNGFACVLYMIQTRVFFDILPDQESYRVYQNLNPFAEEMCLAATEYIQKQAGVPVPFELSLPLYFFFTEWSEKSTLSIVKLKAAVVSTYGEQYARYAARIISEQYGVYIKEVDTIEYTKVTAEKLNGYDLLITDVRPELMPKRYNPVSVYLNFVSAKQKRISQLDYYLDEYMENQTNHYMFFDTCTADEIRTMMNEISKKISGDDKLAAKLMKRIDFQVPQEHENTLFVTAEDSQTKPGLYFMRCDREFQFNGKPVTQVVCCVYGRSDAYGLFILNHILWADNISKMG